MIRFAVAFLLAFVIGCTAHAPRKSNSLSPVSVVLRPDNTVTLRGGIDEDSGFQVQRELLERSKALPPGEPIYLVLQTPGGELVAGLKIVETARGLGRPVHTISIDANSMGFFLVQLLDERLILPTGHIMAHEPTIGVVGQIRKEFLSRLKAKQDFIEAIESKVAKRMQISLFKYRQLISDELHLIGEDAVRRGAADRVVNASCSEELVNQLTAELVQLPNGVLLKVTRSACPFLTGILEMEAVE